jgi:FkbM family methyltransferase
MKLISKLYEFLPSKTIYIIGKSKMLKPIRNWVLRKNGKYKVVKSSINRIYENYKINFDFLAPIKISVKAKKRGIENTLIRNSIKLLNNYVKHNNDCIIIDIGANYGYLSTVWALSVSKNNGKVVSFEPSPSVSEIFNELIQINKLDSKILLKKYATGNRNETIKMYDYGTTANIKNNINKNESFLIKMITLDSFIKTENIEKVDLIKIDTDGYEFEILKGAKNILEKDKPVLIIETNNDQRIINFCKDLNYIILDMSLKPYKSNNHMPLNIFCVNKKIYNSNIINK